MTAEEYSESLKAAHIVAAMLLQIPLLDMLEAQSIAESVAPFIDPTLYMRKVDAFREDQRVLQDLRRAQERLERYHPAAPSRQHGKAAASSE